MDMQMMEQNMVDMELRCYSTVAAAAAAAATRVLLLLPIW
jgi:hypothetical protein